MSEMNLDQDLAQGWRPQEGDVVIGEVLEVTSGWSDYAKDYYPIVTVKPEGKVRQGEDDKSTKLVETDAIAIHCFHQVLRDRMVELRPTPGERLGVKYSGIVKSKDGKRDISVYTVKVEGREQGAQWDTFAPSARQQASQRQQAARKQEELPEGDIPTDDDDEDIPF
jgi:hypothetical protein